MSLRDEKLPVIASLRKLADLIVSTELSAAEWEALREVADHVIDAHGDPHTSGAGASLYSREFRDRLADNPDEVPDIAHPIGLGATLTFPPLDMEWDGDDLVASVHFGPAFEGPPNRVHGGYVAMAFDVVVSAAAFRLTPLTVTRRLKVRYLRPTTLGTTVTFEATPTWLDERRIEVSCRAADADGRTTAKATGECAVLDAERFGRHASAQPKSPSA